MLYAKMSSMQIVTIAPGSWPAPTAPQQRRCSQKRPLMQGDILETTFGDAMANPAGADRYQPSLLTVNGRIGRLRYFTYCCVLTMAVLCVATASVAAFSPMVAMTVILTSYLAFIPATFVLMIRRLNDLDRSGWCSLAAIVPFDNVALGLYATFARGSAGANRFGPAPVPNSRATVIAAVGAPAGAFALGIIVGLTGATFRDFA